MVDCEFGELHWFHAILSTYGSWLPGDARGFRTRNHQKHVDGDYKTPPAPGQYEGLDVFSHNSLKQKPVTFSGEQRRVVCEALRDKLTVLGAVVACVAVAVQHAHVLAKLPKTETRRWMGIAKKHAWFQLRELGWKEKLWAKRPKFVPINDRTHQLNVYNYIVRHAEQGAHVWKHADGA